MSGNLSSQFGLGLAAVLLLMAAGCGLFDGGDPSVTVLPPSDTDPGRWVILEGANNTRDIGGYATQDGRRVRWGRVYRSGQLPDLTPAGCATFESLGVRTVVDFRNRLSPSPLFDGDALCVHDSARVLLLPVSAADTPPGLPTYVERVRVSAESYRRTFELLADEDNLPLMYHCAAGKDRTGIMTALLLTLLGVDRETVMADFRLSDLVGATTKPQAMADLLDEVERQGGIESYLAGIGVTTDAQAAIRASLLE